MLKDAFIKINNTQRYFITFIQFKINVIITNKIIQNIESIRKIVFVLLFFK